MTERKLTRTFEVWLHKILLFDDPLWHGRLHTHTSNRDEVNT